MRRVLVLIFLLLNLRSAGQPVEHLAEELKNINQKVVETSCTKGEGLLISNRAMNFVLSDKVGSYLSQFNDLSFYKNNITFDAAEGTFSLNHNLFQPKGNDTSIRTFLVVGARANIANAFAASFSNKAFQRVLGMTFKQTWLSHPKTSFNCSQKTALDGERALLLTTLLSDLNRKAANFEKDVESILPSQVPGQHPETVKDSLRKNFYKDLREEYHKRFALTQSQRFIRRHAYHKVTLNWTSLSLYLPLIRQQFFVAEPSIGKIARKLSYPVELALFHTRLLELGKKGRFFFTIGATIFGNNSAQSQLMHEVSISDYLRLGGTDTVQLAALNRNNLYRGEYNSFFTPTMRAQVVYFPNESHIGVSGQLEQNFGRLNATNVILGFPIVLIDKETNPSANFQFQIRYFDLGNQGMPSIARKDRISIGMTMGIPFSKIIY